MFYPVGANLRQFFACVQTFSRSSGEEAIWLVFGYPNGGKDCHYRQALPPGYVSLIEEETEKIPIEDEIEEQKSKLEASTPMTPELFMQWKEKKIGERDAGFSCTTSRKRQE